jgi:hypothetical protein
VLSVAFCSVNWVIDQGFVTARSSSSGSGLLRLNYCATYKMWKNSFVFRDNFNSIKLLRNLRWEPVFFANMVNIFDE